MGSGKDTRVLIFFREVRRLIRLSPHIFTMISILGLPDCLNHPLWPAVMHLPLFSTCEGELAFTTHPSLPAEDPWSTAVEHWHHHHTATSRYSIATLNPVACLSWAERTTFSKSFIFDKMNINSNIGFFENVFLSTQELVPKVICKWHREGENLVQWKYLEGASLEVSG